MKKHWFFAALISCGVFLGLFAETSFLPLASLQSEGSNRRVEKTSKEPHMAAIDMLNQRFKVLLEGKSDALKENYVISDIGGQYAYEREKKRVDYLSLWLKARGVVLKEAKATYEVDVAEKDGPKRFWLEITEHAVYSYEYSQDRKRHTFGSRACHVIELMEVDGRWKILRDWYQDPLGNQAFDAPTMDPCLNADSGEAGSQVYIESSVWADKAKGALEPSLRERAFGTQQYQRKKALEYAKKHSGVRSLPDGGRYNPKFRVYTYLGGDCANFASQVLQAGGIDQGGGWHYTAEGSTAWVQGESLVWHLLSSGKGVLLVRGLYQDAVKPQEDYPHGYIAALDPGDIIGYETEGRVCHVAVVVGEDPKGYVTIASHTADRLYFPWDLGWDKSTVFWLIKIVW